MTTGRDAPEVPREVASHSVRKLSCPSAPIGKTSSTGFSHFQALETSIIHHNLWTLGTEKMEENEMESGCIVSRYIRQKKGTFDERIFHFF